VSGDNRTSQSSHRRKAPTPTESSLVKRDVGVTRPSPPGGGVPIQIALSGAGLTKQEHSPRTECEWRRRSHALTFPEHTRAGTLRGWRKCHVRVTGRCQTPYIPEPTTPRALLVVRLWYEHGSSEPLRAELMRSADVTEGFGPEIVLANVDAVCEAVRDWLNNFLDRARDTSTPNSGEGPIRLP